MKTPKEIALEIFNNCRGEKKEAKEMALYVVNEILEIIKAICIWHPYRVFYESVKQEIKKL